MTPLFCFSILNIDLCNSFTTMTFATSTHIVPQQLTLLASLPCFMLPHDYPLIKSINSQSSSVSLDSLHPCQSLYMSKPVTLSTLSLLSGYLFYFFPFSYPRTVPFCHTLSHQGFFISERNNIPQFSDSLFPHYHSCPCLTPSTSSSMSQPSRPLQTDSVCRINWIQYSS